MNVTQDDILEAVYAAMQATPNDGESGISAREWAEHRGISIATARGEIRGLLAAGKLRVVKVRRTRMDGQANTVSGYAPVP